MTKLSDAQILEHGRQYRALKDRAKALEDEANKKHRDPVVAELERRGAKKVEGKNLTVTMTAKTTTTYPYELARRRFAVGVLRRVVRRVVDPKAVKVEIEAGRLAEAEAKAIAQIQTSPPYLVVTPKGAPRKTAAA